MWVYDVLPGNVNDLAVVRENVLAEPVMCGRRGASARITGTNASAGWPAGDASVGVAIRWRPVPPAGRNGEEAEMHLTVRDGLATLLVVATAAYVVLVSAIGALALIAGVMALAAGSAVMLAASMAGLWLIATARHALTSGSGNPSRQSARIV
jgi:hypothetical protein